MRQDNKRSKAEGNSLELAVSVCAPDGMGGRLCGDVDVPGYGCFMGLHTNRG